MNKMSFTFQSIQLILLNYIKPRFSVRLVIATIGLSDTSRKSVMKRASATTLPFRAACLGEKPTYFILDTTKLGNPPKIEGKQRHLISC